RADRDGLGAGRTDVNAEVNTHACWLSKRKKGGRRASRNASYPPFSGNCKRLGILASAGVKGYFRRFASTRPPRPSFDDPSRMSSPVPDNQRIVITGVGLTAPNGNTLAEYR